MAQSGFWGEIMLRVDSQEATVIMAGTVHGDLGQCGRREKTEG